MASDDSCTTCKRKAVIHLRHLDGGLCGRCFTSQSAKRVKRSLKNASFSFEHGGQLTIYDDGTPEAGVAAWILETVFERAELHIERSPAKASWKERRGMLAAGEDRRGLAVLPWTIEDELTLFTEQAGDTARLGVAVGNTLKLPRCLNSEECEALLDTLGRQSEATLQRPPGFAELQERDPAYCFGWLSSIDSLVRVSVDNR